MGKVGSSLVEIEEQWSLDDVQQAHLHLDMSEDAQTYAEIDPR